jgi:ubiquinone/menaquinone biosynthesis C-methylase UbiE
MQPFWNDKKGFRHWILSSLLQARRSQLLSMIGYPSNKRSLIVDVGCNIGYLTRPLSLRAITIGLDMDKGMLSSAKAVYRNLNLICCDLCHLPLRTSSVDIAVCASVFEHIDNLYEALEEIKLVLKKEGELAAGYPIETQLLEFIIKSLWKSESHVWDQSNIKKHNKHLKNPHTHKIGFLHIRKMLGKDFSIVKREKMPKNWFPDFLSIYENVVLVRNGQAKHQRIAHDS